MAGHPSIDGGGLKNPVSRTPAHRPTSTMAIPPAIIPQDFPRIKESRTGSISLSPPMTAPPISYLWGYHEVLIRVFSPSPIRIHSSVTAASRTTIPG